MFQSLRQNNKIFILHKDKPCLETGTVVSVSLPTPKYQMQPFTPNQEMVVDLIVKVNGEDVTYQKIPASLDIADFGVTGIVLADTKEAMNAEVMSLKQRSADILNSVEYHQGVISACDDMLNVLNPEYAEKQAQQAEITSLKEQVCNMTKSIQDLMEANKRLIEQIKIKPNNNENVGN